MSSGTIPLPSFIAVESALRETTERLARELSCPGSAAPQWDEFQWRVAQAVAALHGISALLSGALRWTGPDHWQSFLAEQRTQTLLRHELITQLLSRLDSQARDAGIGFVALKGAALLRLGLYEPGMRPMGDIDLLAEDTSIDLSAQLLTTLGYVESFESWRHRTFVPRDQPRLVPFGEHVSNPVNVELHSRIAERLPAFETDITTFELPRPLHAGLNPYPSVAALMRHLLLHAAGNMRARALRLIQLHDIALLAASMSSADWQELLGTQAGSRGLWWAFPPLTLTARYYPAAIPASVVSTAARACPSWLRQVSSRHELADVSWSKIRVQAFPGIEWSTSPREALLFAIGRIWPGRTALADLSHATSVQPSLNVVPWYGLSHASRILRWIFSRPPRVQTIGSVRAALGHGP